MDLRLLSLLSLVGFAFSAPPGGYPLSRTQYWFDVPLDHFSSGGESSTFKIRYLVDAQYWDPSTGPILFYAGNEGVVEGFWDNSGFITNIMAPQMKGLIVFGEHRYFGQSFPGKKEDAFKPENNIYLTVDQAMMDYNLLIKHIRYEYGAPSTPCIVMGGSYGGMLASWLRMKFP
jgi:lysosomal Pro-X carboxypeptidase